MLWRSLAVPTFFLQPALLILVTPAGWYVSAAIRLERIEKHMLAWYYFPMFECCLRLTWRLQLFFSGHTFHSCHVLRILAVVNVLLAWYYFPMFECCLRLTWRLQLFFSSHTFHSCHVLRILAVVNVFLGCMLKRCPLNVFNSSYAGV